MEEERQARLQLEETVKTEQAKKKAEEEAAKLKKKKEEEDKTQKENSKQEVELLAQQRLQQLMAEQVQPALESAKTATEQAAAWKKQFQDSKKEMAIKEAIIAQGGDTDTVETLNSYFNSRVHMIEGERGPEYRILGEDGKTPRIDAQTGTYLTLEKFALEVKKGKLGRAFPGTNQSGAGLGSPGFGGDLTDVDLDKLSFSDKIKLSKEVGPEAWSKLCVKHAQKKVQAYRNKHIVK